MKCSISERVDGEVSLGYIVTQRELIAHALLKDAAKVLVAEL
jgi:hypothetical protein